jgi:hypothetical protein
MLKKIAVSQLVVGMYLKEFCGSWMDHPFWRSGFVITDPKDITAILSSSIREVWIDSSKGVDIANGTKALSEEASLALVESNFANISVEHRNVSPVTTAQEVQRAVKICESSKQAVISMFEEARMGKAVDVLSLIHI